MLCVTMLQGVTVFAVVSIQDGTPVCHLQLMRASFPGSPGQLVTQKIRPSRGICWWGEQRNRIGEGNIFFQKWVFKLLRQTAPPTLGASNFHTFGNQTCSGSSRGLPDVATQGVNFRIVHWWYNLLHRRHRRPFTHVSLASGPRLTFSLTLIPPPIMFSLVTCWRIQRSKRRRWRDLYPLLRKTHHKLRSSGALVLRMCHDRLKSNESSYCQRIPCLALPHGERTSLSRSRPYVGPKR